MSYKRSKVINVFAPAKINLFLHVTGRLDNGYHTLDSLVSFADIGDQVSIEPTSGFSFSIKGAYSNTFVAKERDASPESSNLVVKAVWAYSGEIKKEPEFRITLTKNLPLASGLGGGSADAAATIWGLSELWDSSKQTAHYMPELLAILGADVPVCMECKATRMQGVGEILQPSPIVDELHVVLVFPGKFCSTKDVFAAYKGPFKDNIEMPEEFDCFTDIIGFLSEQKNDLTDAAITIVPDIALVLETLGGQDGCKMARMSGSGSTCFGLFADEAEALRAAESIMRDNHGWWVRAGTLNRTDRY